MSLLRETKVKRTRPPHDPAFSILAAFSKHPSIISIKPGNKQYCFNKQHPRYKYFILTQTTNHSKISSPPSTSMDITRAQLQDLKAEIEFERRLRRKAESLSRALAIELAEEREAREATMKVCEELAEELVKEREEMERVIEEVEEERRMMRVAETMREERVRMKMSEARMAMEEKMKELEEVMELRDEMGVSVSVTGIYGGFGLSLGLDEGEFDCRRGRFKDFGSSSLYERGKRSAGFKEVECKEELRMLLLRDEKDYMS